MTAKREAGKAAVRLAPAARSPPRPARPRFARSREIYYKDSLVFEIREKLLRRASGKILRDERLRPPDAEAR